jgi:hypothetical protein
MSPSNKWKVRAFEQATKPSFEIQENIRTRNFKALNDVPGTKEDRFKIFDLASAHNSYVFEKDLISRESWDREDTYLSSKKAELIPGGKLDLSNYKTPSLVPEDSQVTFSRFQSQDESLDRIGFIPASHELADDNSQYTSESELKIGAAELEWNEKTSQLSLGSFILYSVMSFQPSDRLIPTLSGALRLGYEPSLSSSMRRKKGWVAHAHLGETYRIHNDVDFYVLTGGGYREVFGGLFVDAEVGVLVREIWNMKSHLSYDANFSRDFDDSPMGILKFTQSLHTRDFVYAVTFKSAELNSVREKSFDLSLKRVF